MYGTSWFKRSFHICQLVWYNILTKLAEQTLLTKKRKCQLQYSATKKHINFCCYSTISCICIMRSSSLNRCILAWKQGATLLSCIRHCSRTNVLRVSHTSQSPDEFASPKPQHPKFLKLWFWGGTQEVTFLTGPQAMVLWPVWGPHFENYLQIPKLHFYLACHWPYMKIWGWNFFYLFLDYIRLQQLSLKLWI